MSKHPGSAWIRQNYNTLPTNQWIAADKNGLVDYALTYDALVNKLQSGNINRSDVVIMFIPENPGPATNKQ